MVDVVYACGLHREMINTRTETAMQTYDSYQSPFSWRYASPEMRRIWSEVNKRLLWRQMWVALAETQAEYGLVSADQVSDLRAFASDIDIERSLQIEAEIRHDVMAEVRTFAEQCPVGGPVIHLGATSMDIRDNAEVLQLRHALDLLLTKLDRLLKIFAVQIERHAALPAIAFTHLQPAEPTTYGYRLSVYAQDLLGDWQTLRRVRAELRGKGFKGAVGTSASYAALLGLENLEAFEQKLSEKLDLPFYPVSSQTYPRKQDYTVLCALAGLGASLYKFAADVRLLQSPPIGEVSEPFGAKQVGSSAMPFKRNPIKAEQIDSLARLLAAMPQTAWENAAHSYLERTLDDSANRRSLLPEAFLICDEIVDSAAGLLEGLKIYPAAIERNLADYAPFAATERVLMELGKRGADRQKMHELLRVHAMLAWKQVQSGQPNDLAARLQADDTLVNYLGKDKLEDLLDVKGYTGLAQPRALGMVAHIRQELHG